MQVSTVGNLTLQWCQVCIYCDERSTCSSTAILQYSMPSILDFCSGKAGPTRTTRRPSTTGAPSATSWCLAPSPSTAWCSTLDSRHQMALQTGAKTSKGKRASGSHLTQKWTNFSCIALPPAPPFLLQTAPGEDTFGSGAEKGRRVKEGRPTLRGSCGSCYPSPLSPPTSSSGATRSQGLIG